MEHTMVSYPKSYAALELILLLGVDYYVREYLNVSSTSSEIRYVKNAYPPCIPMMFALVDNSCTQFDRQYTTILSVLSGTCRWADV